MELRSTLGPSCCSTNQELCAYAKHGLSGATGEFLSDPQVMLPVPTDSHVLGSQIYWIRLDPGWYSSQVIGHQSRRNKLYEQAIYFYPIAEIPCFSWRVLAFCRSSECNPTWIGVLGREGRSGWKLDCRTCTGLQGHSKGTRYLPNMRGRLRGRLIVKTVAGEVGLGRIWASEQDIVQNM
jgi:hypothetical protein